jgi:hypothetical protein
MNPRQRITTLAALAAACLLTAVAASAAGTGEAWTRTVPIVDTPGPGGLLGFNGFDVFAEQAVAARFTVPADGDYRLARVGLWMMNNSETEQRKLRVMVQTDALDEGGPETLPSGVELERWTDVVQTLGWNPVEQFFITKKGPLLQAGRSYWVVAGSMSPPFVDPVWTFAKTGNMWTTTSRDGAWQTAGEGAALTLRIDAHPVKTP